MTGAKERCWTIPNLQSIFLSETNFTILKTLLPAAAQPSKTPSSLSNQISSLDDALRHTTSLLLRVCCSIKHASHSPSNPSNSPLTMPSSTFDSHSQSSSSPTYPPNARVSNKASSAIPVSVAQQPTASRGMSFMSVEERKQRDKVQRLRGGCIPCPVSLQYFFTLVGS